MSVYGVHLSVVEQENIRQTFYLVDDKMLSVSHDVSLSANEQRQGVGRITNQVQVVARFKKRYRQCASLAVPAAFVVDSLRNAADNMYQRAVSTLSAEQLDWWKDIVEFGKFSRFHISHNWDNVRLGQCVSKAEAEGLVRRSAQGFILPQYSIGINQIRRDFQSQE